MQKVKVEYEVPKEAHELMQGLVGVVAAAKQALANGWQPGEDVTAIALASFQSLLPAVQGVDQLPDEWKSDPAGMARAAANGAVDVFSVFKPKPE